MLARNVMVTAIASLVILFGAPKNTLACNKGVPHGNQTSCDGGGGGGVKILSPVLVDGNLEPIGTVVGMFGLFIVHTLVEVQNDIGETRLTALEIDWANDPPFTGGNLMSATVRFDGLECTGRAFISTSPSWDRIADSVVVTAVLDRDGMAEWYVATGADPVRFEAISQLDHSCTSPIGPYDNQWAPADLVEVNIFDRFPLPYSLELR